MEMKDYLVRGMSMDALMRERFPLMPLTAKARCPNFSVSKCSMVLVSECLMACRTTASVFSFIVRGM